MTARFDTLGTQLPDTLIAGDFPMNFEKVTVPAGHVLPRGALLGRVTASGKHVLSATVDADGDPVADGSQTPRALLVDAVDASDGDAEAMVYLSGSFDARSVTFGAGHTAASVKDALRPLGLWLVDTTA